MLRHKHFLQSHPYPAGCEGTGTDPPAKFGGPGSVDLTACKWEVLTRNFSGSLYLPSSVESHKHRARFYTAPIRHHSVRCQIYSGKTTNYTNNVTRETRLGPRKCGAFFFMSVHICPIRGVQMTQGESEPTNPAPGHVSKRSTHSPLAGHTLSLNQTRWQLLLVTC